MMFKISVLFAALHVASTYGCVMIPGGTGSVIYTADSTIFPKGRLATRGCYYANGKGFGKLIDNDGAPCTTQTCDDVSATIDDDGYGLCVFTIDQCFSQAGEGTPITGTFNYACSETGTDAVCICVCFYFR
jgi:hypothetical protein